MKKFALIGATALALASGPALAQAGGGAPAGGPPGGAGNPAGGAADRLAVPDRDEGANAQQMMDRQGQLNHSFTPRGKKAQTYQVKLQEFANQSAGRRAEALALRDAALAGGPILLSAAQIREQLAQDMEDWRTAFKINKTEYEGLRDQILVEESALNARQWADRRAQWFELCDEWIAQQTATLQQGG
jgi:hypothetical protein